MTEAFIPPHRLPAWALLSEDARRLSALRTDSLFAADPQRFADFSAEGAGILLDLSKQRIDRTALQHLLQLAEERRLGEGIAALFAGERLNFTEGRAAWHVACRGSAGSAEALRAYQAEEERVAAFARRIAAGELQGASGARIDTVVNLGIGGSDLGPRLCAEALQPCRQRGLTVHFVANIDPAELEETLQRCEAARTLFIISSKSFSTAETLANGRAARLWLQQQLGCADVSAHFAAVSNAVPAATAFGVPAERVFAMPDWVGGRYSVWSPIGLPLRLAVGEEAFAAFRAGARALDQHFAQAPLGRNLPVLMALAGLWNASLLGAESIAVLPYAHGLRSLPAYLQQLEMESNGKRVLADGSPSVLPTAPVVWGGVGTVGQHAFHQLFYQGTRLIPMDFIVAATPDDDSRRALVANALAQASALMLGRDLDSARRQLQAQGLPADEVERLAPHLVCPGNQPSSTLLLPRLDPQHLGALIALYEHKVFAMGWLLGVNSFDQYGVELGKQMARSLGEGGGGAADPSTAGLLAALAAHRGH